MQNKIFQILNFEFKATGATVEGNQRYFSWRSIDRYYFDRILIPEGFKQFDTSQDAWYFGVWVNPELLCTVTYAEGDITVIVCEDKEHYNAEIRNCIEFYEAGEIMRAISADGHCTVYRQDRNGFLID